MGTFVSNPVEELFDDKESAPGLVLRPGWTSDNVISADNANALRDAAYDLRTAHIALETAHDALQTQVDNASSVGDATPQPVGAAAVVGVSESASREDHVHAHGNQAGGSLHSAATSGAAGFMAAADKSKVDLLTGTNTGDVSIDTANGLSLVSQALSLAVASGGSAGAMSAADKTKLDTVAATASVSIGTLTNPVSVNLSTEGTTDWLDNNQTTSRDPFVAGSLTHRKINGKDVMARSLVIFSAGVAGYSVFANTDSPFTKTTTASDDTFTGALSSTGYTAIASSTAATTGYGFRFDAPCKTTAQTLVLYVGVWSGTITVSATLSNGTTASTTVVASGGASSQKRIPITFTGASAADLLRIKVTLTTNSGSTPHVQFYGATLA
jgi:hypothetical protein